MLMAQGFTRKRWCEKKFHKSTANERRMNKRFCTIVTFIQHKDGIGQHHTRRPVSWTVSECGDQTVSLWASAYWERRHVYDLSETNAMRTASLACSL